METVDIGIETREPNKKGDARRMRRAGRIPAIVYGRKRTARAVSLNADEFDKKLARLEGSHLIRLLHGEPRDADLHEKVALLREVQMHPVTALVLHVDLLEVDLTERLRVSVPLHFVGKAAGVVAGGILQPVLRELEVECLPTEIPQFIEVDVSALNIHEAIHARDVTLPEGVRALGDGSQTLVTVTPPSIEEKPVEVAAEAVPVEGAAPAEGAAAAPTEPVAGGAPSGKKGGEG